MKFDIKAISKFVQRFSFSSDRKVFSLETMRWIELGIVALLLVAVIFSDRDFYLSFTAQPTTGGEVALGVAKLRKDVLVQAEQELRAHEAFLQNPLFPSFIKDPFYY